MREETQVCRESIARHSKSFAMAARLLPRRNADEAAVLYAWCRRADDAVDLASREEAIRSLRRLRRELDDVYAGRPLGEPVLRAFQRVVLERRVDRTYPEELLRGLQMDCDRSSYETFEDLLTYCYRVAGVVGLMMCPTLELRDSRALRCAAHLGMAMQLTNICRDVLEDWEMGRLYVPDAFLREAGVEGLASRLGGPFPLDAKRAMARAVQRLLREADAYYRSGERGLAALPWRCAFSIRTASRVYSAIGRRVERNGCDVTRGRAMVPTRAKLFLAALSFFGSAEDLPARLRLARERREVRDVQALRFREVLLPLEDIEHP